jgi:hypothetical protein
MAETVELLGSAERTRRRSAAPGSTVGRDFTDCIDLSVEDDSQGETLLPNTESGACAPARRPYTREISSERRMHGQWAPNRGLLCPAAIASPSPHYVGASRGSERLKDSLCMVALGSTVRGG